MIDSLAAIRKLLNMLWNSVFLHAAAKGWFLHLGCIVVNGRATAQFICGTVFWNASHGAHGLTPQTDNLTLDIYVFLDAVAVMASLQCTASSHRLLMEALMSQHVFGWCATPPFLPTISHRMCHTIVIVGMPIASSMPLTWYGCLFHVAAEGGFLISVRV